jgi:hypothetical protein
MANAPYLGTAATAGKAELGRPAFVGDRSAHILEADLFAVKDD